MPTTTSELAAGGIVDLRDVFGQLLAIQERVTGTASFVSLSIMTAKPIPQFGWQPQFNCPQSAWGPCDQVGPIRERAHK